MTGAAIAIASGLAFAPACEAAGVQLGGAQDTVAVAPGATFTVDLAILAAGDPFNGFDIGLHFDPALLTFVPTVPVADQRGALMTGACSNTFHLFTPRPDSLSITLVLLCNQVSVTGPGSVYRVQFHAASTDAWTTLTFGPSTTFYFGGPVVSPLVTRSIVVKIGSPSTVGVEPTPPMRLSLAPPGPNPARSNARIRYALSRSGVVSLAVFDPAGRRVRELASGPSAAGEYEQPWDLADRHGLPVADGVYFVRLSGAGLVRTRRLVVAR